MKLYKNLVNAVALTLQDIFTRNRYADKAIEKLFKQNPQWGSRDRRFVAEGVYDIVRNYRLYSEIAQSPNNFWFITGVWLVLKNIEVPEWQEFKHLDRDLIRSQYNSLKTNAPVFESYPDWLWQLCQNELGAEPWQREAGSMNKQAEVFLRTNSLKTTKEKLIEELARDQIAAETVPNSAEALRLVKRENIFRNKLFTEGLFEVQDAGSQQIAPFLEPKPGELVVDACAGAGGKSLHLAALMKNKGKVVSMDLETWKLEELKKRARRAGAFNIETRLISAEALKSLENKADRLLLDVPCSGLGVIKRNPDAKWKLNAVQIERTKTIQKEILRDYSKMVKINGHLVYSTCSILPSENEVQVKEFLTNSNGFELVKERSLLPSDGFDGFYMALIKRVR